MALTRTRTVTTPVEEPIADLILFVRKLENAGKIVFTKPMPDSELLEWADDFYDSQHGED